MLLSLLSAIAVASPLAIGDGEVFALVPNSPGYPEGITVAGGSVFVAGPAAEQNAVDPVVWRYDRQGNLQETIVVPESPYFPIKAFVGATVDAEHRPYVVSLMQGVVRLNKDGNNWQPEVYGGPYYPLFPNAMPFPNDLTFDVHGNLYVTDAFQGVVWKTTPGDDTTSVWLQDPLLASPAPQEFLFGVNGVRIDPTGHYMYLAYSGGPSANAPNGVGYHGRIYRVPLANPAAGLELVYEYGPTDIADAIAFSKDGSKLLVTLAHTSAISVLDIADIHDVTETMRISDLPSSDIPLAEPAVMDFFDGQHILVTNHALYSGVEYSAVLKVNVGFPVARPDRPYIP